MNYAAFIKKVDEYAGQKKAEELRLFIRKMAEGTSENERENFLTLLSGSGILQSEGSEGRTLEEQVDFIMERLQAINDGEMSLDSDCDEDYYDWTYNDDNEFVFSDSDHLLDSIDSAFDLIHLCLDREAYEKGAELAEMLAMVQVQVGGAYSEFSDDVMDIDDLNSYDLLHADYNDRVKEGAYMACVGNGKQERAAALYTVLSGFHVTDMKLEDIIGTGPVEIDMDEFLPDWISEVAAHQSIHAKKLLLEATALVRDEETALKNAGKYASDHPELYVAILKSGKGKKDPKRMMEIGRKALSEIPWEKKERVTIALQTAAYAMAASETETAENCWMEAFQMDSSVINYLRLRMLTRHWQDYRPRVCVKIDELYRNAMPWGCRSAAGLCFFEGRFDDLRNKFMKPGNGIGWSSSFMKEGIAMMLLYLDSSEKKARGMISMGNRAQSACDFTAESFYEGTNTEPAESSEALFFNLFEKWRKDVPMEESEQEEWLSQIGEWISLRVSAILGGQHRNQYSECAAFIAALGEVQEARGIPGAKDAIMQKYRTQYRHYRSFIKSLREYGLKG